MKIKFKAPDPRAGSVAELDSNLAQRFIDEGRATKVSGDDSNTKSVEVAPVNKAIKGAPANAARKAPSKKVK